MGMDLDYLAAKQSLDSLSRLLSKTPHGERESIADDIILAVAKIEEKHRF